MIKAHEYRTAVTAILFVVLILPLTGCANRIEINNRSLVLGVAIDKPQPPEEKNKGEEQPGGAQQGKKQGEASKKQGQGSGDYLRVEPPPEDQISRYAMTIETPIIRQLGGGGEGGGGGSGGGQGSSNKWVITSTGNTIWDMERHLSIRVGRQNFYGHLKAIVISEEVAREGIQPIMDFFTRRREVQQNIKLAISNGEARKVLQVTPLEENYAALYINAMLESLYRTGAKINTDMLEIRRSLADSGNAVLPRVRASSPTEIIAGGAAVIKDWRFVGWLSEFETSGYNIATGRVVGGAITLVDPKNETGLVTVLLRDSQTKSSVKMVDQKPVFTIETVSEWDIVERGTGTLLWDQKYLDQVAHLAELEWQRRVILVIDKMQREFKTDIFGFGGMLSKKYPDYWKRVAKDWDDKYFPEVEVIVQENAKVRRTETKR